MFYIAKTPKWVRKLYGGTVWQMPESEKKIYLTFDDGPHPEITPFVLDELAKFNAKATFFCIGKNVVSFPAVYKRILDEGHGVGNHTFDHLDGWRSDNAEYIANILKAREYIDSELFRPPYGRITWNQQKDLTSVKPAFKVIMWSVLSGDFDINISPEQCFKNVIKNTESGSVIVFHDSEKANKRMRYTLPLVLKYFFDKDYFFEKL
jgi:peptidoglycan/xylan/chitin deacetylase (PgdA/CDA1 family)